MIIDLTRYIDENTKVLPDTPSVRIKQLSTLVQHGYNEQQITITSHTSTHIDAPNHMISSGKTLSDYPLDRFIGDAIVINVCGQREIKPDLTAVKRKDIVFFYTGYDLCCNGETIEKSPVVSEETALYLIDKQVPIVGIDSFTPDIYPYPIHQLLFGHDICIVEQLTNLDKIPQQRFTCYILPLKLHNSDGAPCRVIAQIP